jgi:hypothetical protein
MATIEVGRPVVRQDHARVGRLLFDGVLDPVGGKLRPDQSQSGMGLELKRVDAERYRRA